MICEVVYAKLSSKIWVREVKSAWKKKKTTKQNQKPEKKQLKQGDIFIYYHDSIRWQ